MKLLRKLYYPDLVGGIFVLFMFFTMIWGWPESRRPFIESVVMFSFGVFIGMSGISIDNYYKKRPGVGEPPNKKHQFLVRTGGILFMILGFLTNYVPMFARYWIFSFLDGFVGTIIVQMIIKEVKRKKRYKWEDL